MQDFEITIETKELIQSLSIASSIVEKRSSSSDNAAITLRADNNTLELTATDMDMYVKQNIGAQVKLEGKVSLGIKVLNDIVKKIPDKEFTMKLANNALQLIGKQFCFNLPIMQGEMLGLFNDDSANIAIDALLPKDLINIIENTQYAMSSEETRYNLNGIYLHVKNKALYAAATDGHRLSVASFELKKDVQEFGVIIPRKAVGEIVKIIKDPRNIYADVNLSLSANKIKITCNRIILISKLIDGNFPDYQNLIPEANENKLVINCKLFSEAVDRVAIVTLEKFRAVKFIFNELGLNILADSESRGTAEEKIPVSTDKDDYCQYQGNDLKIGFNPRYLADALSAIKSEQAEIYFKDASLPVLITSAIYPSTKCIVMPVKI